MAADLCESADAFFLVSQDLNDGFMLSECFGESAVFGVSG